MNGIAIDQDVLPGRAPAKGNGYQRPAVGMDADVIGGAGAQELLRRQMEEHHKCQHDRCHSWNGFGPSRSRRQCTGCARRGFCGAAREKRRMRRNQVKLSRINNSAERSLVLHESNSTKNEAPAIPVKYAIPVFAGEQPAVPIGHMSLRKMLHGLGAF